MIVRERFIPSEHLSTRIESKQRCQSIDELNKTLSRIEYIQRVKFYPLICRKDLELICFYDDHLMCICDSKRFSNCFAFKRTMNNNCQERHFCENHGRCFENNQTCPTRLTCICPDCFYGSKCQFSTKGFLVSLDAILGYHIQQNIPLTQQPVIIKLSIALSIIMFVIGFLSSFVIFDDISSENSSKSWMWKLFIFFIDLFFDDYRHFNTYKFWHLILTQMLVTTNELYLYLSCITLDVTLNIFTTSNEWLILFKEHFIGN